MVAAWVGGNLLTYGVPDLREPSNLGRVSWWVDQYERQQRCPVFDLPVNLEPDLQNGGNTADGVALFALQAFEVTESSVPVDTVLYGGTNQSNLKEARRRSQVNTPDVTGMEFATDRSRLVTYRNPRRRTPAQLWNLQQRHLDGPGSPDPRRDSHGPGFGGNLPSRMEAYREGLRCSAVPSTSSSIEYPGLRGTFLPSVDAFRDQLQFRKADSKFWNPSRLLKNLNREQCQSLRTDRF